MLNYNPAGEITRDQWVVLLWISRIFLRVIQRLNVSWKLCLDQEGDLDCLDQREPEVLKRPSFNLSSAVLYRLCSAPTAQLLVPEWQVIDNAAGLASRSKLIQFPPWEKCKWWTKCKGSTSHDNIISQVSHVQASPGFPEFWNHVVLSFQKDILLCPNKLTYAFLPAISAVKLAQNGLSDGIAIGRLLWPDWPVGTY